MHLVIPRVAIHYLNGRYDETFAGEDGLNAGLPFIDNRPLRLQLQLVTSLYSIQILPLVYMVCAFVFVDECSTNRISLCHVGGSGWGIMISE